MELDKKESLETKLNKSFGVKANGHLNLSIKDVDLKKRIVTGMYYSCGVFDNSGDILLPGCANRSIKNNGPGSEAVAKIKHALFHDLTLLPGHIQVLEEKTIDGLTGGYFETKMVDTQIGNDTLINYQEKIYDNHSIGYQYVKMELVEKEAHGNSKAWENLINQCINPKDMDEAGFAFAVSEIKLFEGSTVAFGCNRLTPYLGVKSNNPDSLKLAYLKKLGQLQKALKSGTQSDEMLYSFELQIKQFEQMVEDICELIPVQKTSLDTCGSCSKTFENLIEKGMGYSNCPYCGTSINTAEPKQETVITEIKQELITSDLSKKDFNFFQ